MSQGRRGDPPLLDLLGACHERIRGFLRIAASVGEAEAEAVAESEVTEACLACERYFQEALPLHVRDEEESIEPRLRGRDPEVDAALATMQDEHRDHAPHLEAMLAALRAVRASPDDLAPRAALRDATARLAAAFEPHLVLEERVVFPAISALLPPSAQAEIVAELRARRRG